VLLVLAGVGAVLIAVSIVVVGAVVVGDAGCFMGYEAIGA
jgi:hypothetical protein